MAVKFRRCCPKTRLFAVSMVVFVFLCSGCSVAPKTFTTDNLPPDAVKSYAEFYAEGGKTLGYQIPIYLVKRQIREIQMGTVGMRVGSDRRRIAVEPGMHTFVARLGKAEETIEIETFKDMVTPVKITINELGSASTSFGRSIYFEMNLLEEKPYNLSQRPTGGDI